MTSLISIQSLISSGIPPKYAYLLGNFYYNTRGWLGSYNSNMPRFCIFAQGRSGSTLLTTLLDQHPHIKCEGEVLANSVGNAHHFIQGKSIQYSSKKLAWGFKVKHHQLTKHQKIDPQTFLKKLSQEGWKVIYLRRENIVLQALSTLIGMSRGKWTYPSFVTLRKVK